MKNWKLLLVDLWRPNRGGEAALCCVAREERFVFISAPWRRQRQPTPILLPGKSHGQRSLVGCSPWGCLRVGHHWVTSLSLFTFIHWRRKWQPTPVFLPGESRGRGEPGGLPSMGSHRVRHGWNSLAAAAAVLHSDKRNLVELLNLTVVACSSDLFFFFLNNFSLYLWISSSENLPSGFLSLRPSVKNPSRCRFQRSIRYNFQTPSGYTDDNASGNKQGCCVKPTWLVWLHGNKDAQHGLLTLQKENNEIYCCLLKVDLFES